MAFGRTYASRWCACAISWCVPLLLVSHAAAADSPICKYIDAEGNPHYQNVAPEKGWRKLSCIGEEGSSRSSDKTQRTSPSPAGFPRVDPDTQRSRDDVRRKVLTDELSTEEKLLAEARTAYGDGAPPPLPEEKNDAQKYANRLGKLRQAVSLHERNIEALKKELGALR
jgi:hypothetical protein